MRDDGGTEGRGKSELGDQPALRFALRLARDLHMTLAALFREMTPREFTMWATFYKWESDDAQQRQDEQTNQNRAEHLARAAARGGIR